MDILDILNIVSDYEGMTINTDKNYDTCFLAEKYGFVHEDSNSDTMSLRRDIPEEVICDEDLLRGFLNKMDSDFEKMRNSVRR